MRQVVNVDAVFDQFGLVNHVVLKGFGIERVEALIGHHHVAPVAEEEAGEILGLGLEGPDGRVENAFLLGMGENGLELGVKSLQLGNKRGLALGDH